RASDGTGDVVLLRIGGGHAAAAECGDAEKLRDDGYGVRRELAAAGAGARTRGRFQLAEIVGREFAGRVRADGLVDVLNRHLAAVPRARRNRAAVEDQPGNVQARQRHRPGRDGLVAADEHNQTVEAVAAGDQLDRVGD